MDEVIEMFGKKLKVVTDESNSADFCKVCAISIFCQYALRFASICQDAKGMAERHFEEVTD